MTRERKVKLLTIGAMILALGIAVGRRSARRGAEAIPFGPKDTIYAMFNSARAGDVQGYLARYTGPMEQSLAESVRESSPDAFARYLRDSNAAVKGLMIAAPEPDGDDEVKVRVEYVYQDRNEVQIMHLRKTGGGWRISRVEGAERVRTLVPYGTPVE